ncbi:neurexin-4 isoform X2 [Tachypleus tridentatus]|uniref:neurexin-4 isoform X2 n=1 Tax=Tachypleus tridentatus TaxID=6853 RepID=UPI003FD3AA15
MKKIILISWIYLLHISIASAEASCNEALLKDASLSATSFLSEERRPEKARLYGGGAWTARNSDFSQYLILDLQEKKNITAIATQGRPYTSEFVQEYQLEYGNNGLDYTEYKDKEGNTRLFEGNEDGDTVSRNDFDTPIIAQWIRINPTRWRDRISMRIELYGCNYVAESINFDGQSYVSMDLSKRVVASQEDVFRFRFRTNHADGLMLYSRASQGDFFALQLVGNQLVLNMDLGGEGIMTSVKVGSLLDDNLWHDVMISRYQRDVTFNVDRVVVKERIRGDFTQLNLNSMFYIGGLPNFNQDGLVVAANFTGCVENLFINHTNVVAELKADDGYFFEKQGEIFYSCRYEQVIPVTFTTSESHLKVIGYMQRTMNSSFDFRTFNKEGMLLYNKFSVEGHVKIFLEDGKIKIEIKGKGTPEVIIEPFDELLNDGKWHTTMIILMKDKIELHVDGRPSITKRTFSMQTGQEYLIGGGVYESQGFVGCMRYIYVEGRYIHVLSLPSNRYTEGVVFDACQMFDRCNPNPCEHGGVCNQDWDEFTCECSKTGYTGAVCHVPRHPLSCEAYKIDNPSSKQVDIKIDVDGSGPLDPFPVTCEFPSDDETITVLHHKNEQPTDVKGFDKPGSYIRDIIYNAGMEQIVELVNRSYSCSQHLKYDCLNARLFNTPVEEVGPFEPFSWWVSRNNQKMDYWGGSLPGSKKCACGLFGICRNPKQWCNCDSMSQGWQTDEGDITQKEYLPVRQLKFGDTGTTLDKKKGRYFLGSLRCEGDSLFDNVVTFRYDDATIELPPFNMGHAWDIYFQFKTTAENGVLIHSRGPTDFIKIMLVGGDQIQFQYHGGNGPLGVSVETTYKLNNDEWHSVLVEFNRKEARIVVDGSINGEVQERSGPVRALYLTSQLVIGATVDYRQGYVGCLRALVLNGEMIDLRNIVGQGLYGLTDGCVGKCESNPCLNNGTCLEGYANYLCDCQWTAFKGPICADEIGVNLRAEDYIRYDFETTISTLEEYIRVQFTTTEHHGLIVGVSSFTEEYLSLVMSTSGHLRLVFDFGFERQEIIIKNENFALGQNHDIKVVRSDKGTKMTIYVDNHEPLVYTFKIEGKADAQFNRLKSIYVGRNETMESGDGFIGCISRVQFDDHFPLRRLFQESRRSNVRAYPETVREDTCGIEPVTHPPELSETRPPPTLPPGVLIEVSEPAVDDSAILGVVLAIIFVALILMAILIGRFMSRHKGEYKTHEDKGAKDAPDADTAVIQSKTGPDVSRKKEWFI